MPVSRASGCTLRIAQRRVSLTTQFRNGLYLEEYLQLDALLTRPEKFRNGHTIFWERRERKPLELMSRRWRWIRRRGGSVCGAYFEVWTFGGIRIDEQRCFRPIPNWHNGGSGIRLWLIRSYDQLKQQAPVHVPARNQA